MNLHNLKICLIYNFAQHYRVGIFKLLDKELNCDFYFGDKMDDVKKLDYSELKNFKNELKNKSIISPIYWQSGAISVFFKPYDRFIMLGEYFCITTWIILLFSKFSSKKIFLWTHGWYGNEGFLKRIIKKVFFKLSDGLFLYGDYAKQLMINEGFDVNKLHVLYNSLDYEKQLLTRNQLASNNIYVDYFKNYNPVLLFIGRLTRIKKLDQIIDALNFLKLQGKFYNLVLIGKGEEMDFLKEKVSNLKLNDVVWFYGSTYDEFEIGNLIYNADLCVSPGNVGLTAMHSLVYGTPVITNSDFSSQMPEFEAIEKNVTGDFFEKNNVQSIVRTIINWSNTKKTRNEIRNNCFEVIDNKFNPNYQLKVIKENIQIGL